MKNDYAGQERRTTHERREMQIPYPCPLHDIFTKGIEKDLKAGENRMQRFEQKIDTILAGQVAQNLEIQSLKNALGNGLGKDIKDAKQSIEDLKGTLAATVKKYDEKFIEFDEFRWFRVWANGVKNKSVSWALTFVVIGGAFAFLVVGICWLIFRF